MKRIFIFILVLGASILPAQMAKSADAGSGTYICEEGKIKRLLIEWLNQNCNTDKPFSMVSDLKTNGWYSVCCVKK